MVYTIRSTLDPDKMKHVALDRQLEALQESVHRARARTKQKVDAALIPTPGAVKYPIKWTSEKQRRAFFATDGFGRGIPYRRSGLMQEGWVSFSETIQGLGTRIVLFNSVTYAQFVVGRFEPSTHMQGFHRETGWRPVLTKRDMIKNILIDGILKEFRWIVA